jgi:hypothetical protein
MTMEQLRLSVEGIPWFLRYFPVASIGAVESHGSSQAAPTVGREWGDLAAPPEGVFHPCHHVGCSGHAMPCLLLTNGGCARAGVVSGESQANA